MEVLYTKLHRRYTVLKKKKLLEMDEVDKDQEVKFLNYVSAAEEMIQHLKDENDRLHDQIAELKKEVTSMRSEKDEQCTEHQKLLLEENHKNKLLTEEVERLQLLFQEKPCASMNGEEDTTGPRILQFDQLVPPTACNGSLKRKRKYKHGSNVSKRKKVPDAIRYDNHDTPEDDFILEKNVPQNLESHTVHLPNCCKVMSKRTDDLIIDDQCRENCVFQFLIEHITGMKLSPIIEKEGSCILIVHKSSGYSFSLTWVVKADESEPELLYCVRSLGTFDKIAPEWMRSILLFSMSMCRLFFERVVRVIKHSC